MILFFTLLIGIFYLVKPNKYRVNLNQPKNSNTINLEIKKERNLFSERNLTLPIPASLTDLLSNLTSFDEARLADGQIDGDFCTYYRGIFLGDDDLPKRIQFNRTFSDNSYGFNFKA
jgi:hypothetical protein